jgi:hypothetical protein
MAPGKLSSLAFVLEVLAEGTVIMPDLPIHNETEFSLTQTMLEQIKRDAIESFGEAVRAIKVQYGIERHAFNIRTGEVRYAFSPGDFGMIDTTLSLPEPYFHRADIPTIDDDAEEALLPSSFDDIAVDETGDGAESLESLEEEEADEDEAEEAAVAFQDLDEDEDDDNEDDDDEDDDDEDDQFDDLDDDDSRFIEYDDDYN